MTNKKKTPNSSSVYQYVGNELPDEYKNNPPVSVSIEGLEDPKVDKLLEAMELINEELKEAISNIRDLDEKVDWVKTIVDSLVNDVDRLTNKPSIGKIALKPAKLPMRDREYVVKEGDTIALIARELYGNPGNFKILMSYNKLQDGVALQPGQVLKIPSIP